MIYLEKFGSSFHRGALEELMTYCYDLPNKSICF